MAETDTAPEGEPADVFKAEGDGPMSVAEAADAMAKAREAAQEAPPKPEEDEKPPPSPPEVEAKPPAETDGTAPPEEAPGDATEEVDAAAELPPIDPPRSWSKEDKELFAALPRETQERTAQSWQARERDINRRQQEAAEQRKALEAEREKTAQVRQQYEQALPNVLAAAQAQWDSEFPDIKTWADAEKLQAEDFVRYQKFDLVRQKALAARQELDSVQQQQAEEARANFRKFAQIEDAEFVKLAPEMANPEKARALQAAADKMLTEIGFTKDQKTMSWEGRSGISMRDHRAQLLILKATLWDQAQAKTKQIRQTPVPPVLKPGTSRSTKGDVDAAEIANLQKQLQQASGRRAVELATRLQQLKRPAS